MNILTDKNFATLRSHLNDDAPIAGVDFETFYSKTCSVRELGPWAYCQHDDWDCYLVAVARKTKEGIRLPTYVGDPKLFPWGELEGYRLYSHNAMFDHTVYRRMVELGQVPDIEPRIEGWDCTADFSAYACNRRSLKDAVAYFFKRELSKAVRDDAIGKRWPNDFSEKQRADMLQYGGSDADECLNLAELAQESWPYKERLLSRLNRLQGMRGVQLDIAKLDTMLEGCRRRETELRCQLPWVGRGEKPTSPKALAEFCRSRGAIPPPVKAKEGEEAFIRWEETVAKLADCKLPAFLNFGEDPAKHEPTDEDVETLRFVHSFVMALPHERKGKALKFDLSKLPEQAPWYGDKALSEVLKALADFRSITKFAKQLETLRKRSDADGVYRFSLKYAGAHTLRFSGDSGFNMQNITKADPGSPDSVWVVVRNGAVEHAGVMTPDRWPAFFKARESKDARKKNLLVLDDTTFMLLDMRSLFIPRKGESFVIADSSQIEPRCLAFLTKDRKFIDLVKSGVDIYEAHARTMHGFTGPIGSLKHLANEVKDSAAITLRARSKAERLGLGYQAGPDGYRRAAAMLAGLVLTEEESLEAVRAYREANQNVVSFWLRLQTALESASGSDLRVKLPNGRSMKYEKVGKEKKAFIDKATNKPSYKWQLTADVGGKRFGFYGGKLCENLTQGMARDVFVEYVLAIWENSLLDAVSKGFSGFAALAKSLECAPLWTVHDEAITAFPTEIAVASKAAVETVMNSTPDWAGDTPFACEASIDQAYKK